MHLACERPQSQYYNTSASTNTVVAQQCSAVTLLLACKQATIPPHDVSAAQNAPGGPPEAFLEPAAGTARSRRALSLSTRREHSPQLLRLSTMHAQFPSTRQALSLSTRDSCCCRLLTR